MLANIQNHASTAFTANENRAAQSGHKIERNGYFKANPGRMACSQAHDFREFIQQRG